MNLIEAPSDLKVVETDNGIEIVWSLALGNPDGCEVYHVKDNMGYELLSPTFITNSSFVFECPDTNKAYRILVAAIKLIRTPSGAYCAYSPGIIDTITPMRSFLPTPSFETMTLNDFGNVFFVNLSENLNAFYWSFRDVNTSIEENPQHQYSNEGN